MPNRLIKKADVTHAWKFIGNSPHNNEDWYRCESCGAEDWFATYSPPEKVPCSAVFHARDWYTPSREDVLKALELGPASRSLQLDNAPRSYRTNICEIPDYVFGGGTIDTKTLKAINCPNCLVMIDGLFAGVVGGGKLELVDNIPHLEGAEHEKWPETRGANPVGAHKHSLLHGRNTT